ncbi:MULTISPECIES: type II toxin-antitoxin system prevent-host-death family antitoxin [unclassified Frigoribacterium]|uniref:type II toxin-antitoxin system prevent-host-death family antitoxin n=1 Tax=unclassified Frigoribacterium TaxID=2627005 RepID=UPI0006F7975E|nr:MULTISPECIES: type II toxin-antitoxin system prevent-host-death family antitoxin [unclassified Frigoribacterium]KQO45118.1 hypothetical protein ASF07_15330 [Frigoribacterium sp. Leaf254]KQT40568.1 hypothetical protein ASG28_14450 [Frigoribacterium sp. Leaf415]
MTLAWPTTYATASEARRDFKRVLDASEHGATVTVSRDSYVAAVVDAERLRSFLARTVVAGVRAFHDDGAWAVVMEGRPFAAEAVDLDEAVADLAASLREYAADWNDHLQAAPNHSDNWGLVQLVALSDDEQLLAWLNHAA